MSLRKTNVTCPFQSFDLEYIAFYHNLKQNSSSSCVTYLQPTSVKNIEYVCSGLFAYC